MFDGRLAMSFSSSFNYPARAYSIVHTHGNVCRTRFSPALAVPPSSVILQTDESDNLPEVKKRRGPKRASRTQDSPGSLLRQENTVGIIGGVSVESSLNFVRKLVQWSSQDKENGLGLPFVLCSDPVLNKDLLSLERSSIPSISSKIECSPVDHNQIVENLRSKRVFLEKSGAHCIVMPCHVSHTWYNEVGEGCPVSFLHMAECVAKELKEAKLKPLEAGSPLRIGLLATDAVLSAGFYQEKLQNEGFEVLLPDKATMDHTVIPAIEASNQNDIEGASNLLRIALQVLLVRAVNTVILGSDEIRDLLPQDDPLLKKCVDPMDSLARSTIKWAQAAQKGP